MQTVQQVQQLGENLVTLSGRINSLEKDSTFITTFLTATSKEGEFQTNEFKEHVDKARETINNLTAQMKNCSIELDRLIQKIRYAANKEELAALQERVDAWNPEGFVTKEEFKRSFR
ncbi:hypothetical protein C4573_06190 [Candidatus Woesearchaeota archaeon]|nr:MAG: hypothetical protein C4573_06190 [Candidatus Woesearchaeota archaeon]